MQSLKVVLKVASVLPLNAYDALPNTEIVTLYKLEVAMI